MRRHAGEGGILVISLRQGRWMHVSVCAAIMAIACWSSLAIAQADDPTASLSDEQLLKLAQQAGPHLPSQQQEVLFNQISDRLAGSDEAIAKLSFSEVENIGNTFATLKGSLEPRNQLILRWMDLSDEWKKDIDASMALWIAAARLKEPPAEMKQKIFSYSWEKHLQSPQALAKAEFSDLYTAVGAFEDLYTDEQKSSLASMLNHVYLSESGKLGELPPVMIKRLTDMIRGLDPAGQALTSATLAERWIASQESIEDLSVDSALTLLLFFVPADDQEPSPMGSGQRQLVNVVWSKYLGPDAKLGELSLADVTNLAKYIAPWLDAQARASLRQNIAHVFIEDKERAKTIVERYWSSNFLPAFRALEADKKEIAEIASSWYLNNDSWFEGGVIDIRSGLHVVTESDSARAVSARERLIAVLFEIYFENPEYWAKGDFTALSRDIGWVAEALTDAEKARIAVQMDRSFTQDADRMAKLTPSDLSIMVSNFNRARAFQQRDAFVQAFQKNSDSWRNGNTKAVQALYGLITGFAEKDAPNPQLEAFVDQVAALYLENTPPVKLTLKEIEEITAAVAANLSPERKASIAESVWQRYHVRPQDSELSVSSYLYKLSSVLATLDMAAEKRAEMVAAYLQSGDVQFSEITPNEGLAFLDLFALSENPDVLSVRKDIADKLYRRFILDDAFWAAQSRTVVTRLTSAIAPHVSDDQRLDLLNRARDYTVGTKEQAETYSVQGLPTLLRYIGTLADSPEYQSEIVATWSVMTDAWKEDTFDNQLKVMAWLTTNPTDKSLQQSQVVADHLVATYLESGQFVEEGNWDSFTRLIAAIAPVLAPDHRRKIADELFTSQNRRISETDVDQFKHILTALNLLEESTDPDRVTLRYFDAWLSQKASFNQLSPTKLSILINLARAEDKSSPALLKKVSMAVWQRAQSEPIYLDEENSKPWSEVLSAAATGFSDDEKKLIADQYYQAHIENNSKFPQLTFQQIVRLAQCASYVDPTALGRVTIGWTNQSDQWQSASLGDLSRLSTYLTKDASDPGRAEAEGRLAKFIWNNYLANDKFLQSATLAELDTVSRTSSSLATQGQKQEVSAKLASRFAEDPSLIGALSYKDHAAYQEIQYRFGVSEADRIETYALWILKSKAWKELEPAALTSIMTLLEKSTSPRVEEAKKLVASHIWQAFLKQSIDSGNTASE